MAFTFNPPPLKPGRTAQWMIAGLVALGPFSLTMYQPALPVIGPSLNATPGQIQLTLTVYLATFALGQLVYGPLSDHFGRRQVLLGGLGVFVLGAAGCALARSVEVLIAARLIQGLGACAGPALGRAIIRDLYGPTNSARALAFVASALSIAPAIAPVFGSYVATWLGWQAIFVALGLVGTGILLFVLLRVPETNPYATTGRMLLGPVFRSYGTLLRSRTYWGYMGIAAASTAGSLAFQTAAPFVLMDRLGVSSQQFGWILVGLTAAYFCGTLLAQRLARGPLLRALLIGSSLLVASGSLQLGMALAGVVWVSTVTLTHAVWLMGMGIILPGAMAGAVGPFPTMAGAAAALQGFAMMAAGAAASLLLAQWGISAVVLGAVMCAVAVIGLAIFSSTILLAPRQPNRG